MAENDNKPRGRRAVLVAIGDGARELERKRARRDDPPPSVPRGQDHDVKAGQATQNALGLPVEDPCPVQCLGIEGEMRHMIDSSGQFVSLAAGDFSHAGMQSLFAATPNWPQWAYPRFGRGIPKADGTTEFPIKSFDDDKLRSALFLACARAGLFSPTDKLRGRGAWTLRGGEIVYHAGEELWFGDGEGGNRRIVARAAGMHDGHLYARYPAVPDPWTERMRPEDNPAPGLLDTFRKWNWERPEVDPILLLGWIGVAFLGAALDWRSAVLLLGGHGTGKSSLQDGLKDLFGEALFHSGDTTAAGIYQDMKNDARPVALDELEASADQRKVDNVVTLMRAASSGAFARRGSAGHEAVAFRMQSAFLFSAINNPVHESQDLSRIAVLRLRALNQSQTRPPAIDTETCGRKLLARLILEWPRFRDTREQYMSALSTGGHEPRGQKTYGTLLAAADLLLGAEGGEAADVPLTQNTDDLRWWTEHLSADALPEVEDALPNWRRCLSRLLTSQVEVWRNGARSTVGQCLEDLELGRDNYNVEHAKRDLGLTGLGLVVKGDVASDRDGWVLAIPNDHPQVRKLFHGTPWQGGGWKDALRQCPVAGVMLTDKKINRVKIGGEQERCTLVVMGRYHNAPER